MQNEHPGQIKNTPADRCPAEVGRSTSIWESIATQCTFRKTGTKTRKMSKIMRIVIKTQICVVLSSYDNMYDSALFTGCSCKKELKTLNTIQPQKARLHGLKVALQSGMKSRDKKNFPILNLYAPYKKYLNIIEKKSCIL